MGNNAGLPQARERLLHRGSGRKVADYHGQSEDRHGVK